MKNIKSKKRVAKYGEVFTPPHIVKQMCDLLPPEAWTNISAKFFEPCCGTGNFAEEILRRKFSICNRDTNLGLIALGSYYTVEIQLDNVCETRERILNIFKEYFKDGYEEAENIISYNVIHGDLLNFHLNKRGKKVTGDPVYAISREDIVLKDWITGRYCKLKDCGWRGEE